MTILTGQTSNSRFCDRKNLTFEQKSAIVQKVFEETIHNNKNAVGHITMFVNHPQN